ncbi:Phosphoglucomutase-2 [Gurleya vavrai]
MDKKSVNKLIETTEKYVKICSNRSVKAELTELINEEKYDVLSDMMRVKIKLSTGGIRGIMKTGLLHINEVTMNVLATTLCNYYKEISHIINKKGKEKKSIYIGYDNRYNSTFFAYIVALIFSKNNYDVYISPRSVISPFVPFAVKKMQLDLGIMITASHNSKEYNGMKIWFSNGYQISDPYDKELEKMLEFVNFTELDLSHHNIFLLERDQELIYREYSIENFKDKVEHDFEKLIIEYTNYIFFDWFKNTKDYSKIKTKQKILFCSLCGPSNFF